MHSYRRTSRGALAAVGLMLLLLASAVLGFGLTALSGSGSPAASLAASPAAASASPAAIVTHGDLWVTSGETFVIQPPSGFATYYQGGNITVLAGVR